MPLFHQGGILSPLSTSSSATRSPTVLVEKAKGLFRTWNDNMRHVGLISCFMLVSVLVIRILLLFLSQVKPKAHTHKRIYAMRWWCRQWRATLRHKYCCCIERRMHTFSYGWKPRDLTDIFISSSFLFFVLQPSKLNVYKNDSESWDYTNPNLGKWRCSFILYVCSSFCFPFRANLLYESTEVEREHCPSWYTLDKCLYNHTIL